MKTFVKIASVALLAAVVFAPSAKAQTTAELQAQIAALLAQIQTLQSQLAGGGSTSGTSASYTQNLTIGSKGTEVTALQNFLYSKGFLKTAATGYFGSLTKAALASYQASVGISPASGYFGPVSRAHFNSMVVVNPTGTPGTSTTPTPGASGMEGILTVDTNPTPASGAKYYEGDSNVALLGLKVKAQNAEITVQRVKVGLGTSVTAYTKTLQTLSIYDGSTQLASQALNSSSVVKEGNTYYVYFSGLNVRVNKDETKVLTLHGTFYGTVDTSYRSLTLTIPANGVRGVDGAALQQEAPTSAITRSLTVSADLTESASLTISKNANSPKSANLVSNNQGDITEATVLALDFKAEDDMAKVDEMVVTFAGTATETAAYLYDGSTLLGSATVSSNVATFTDMEDVFQVSKDSTKTVTLRVSYTGANATAATSSATVATSTVIASNSEGLNYGSGSLAISGGATSDDMTVISAGPVFSLSSTNAVKSTGVQGVSSSTAEGTITLSVTAAGGDVYFDKASTSLELYAYANGGSTSSTVDIELMETLSSNFTLVSGTTYKLAEGTTGTMTVKAVKSSAGLASVTSYDFRLSAVKWGTASGSPAAKTTSLDTNVYKTSSVTLP